MLLRTLERHILSQLNHTPVKHNPFLPKYSTASFPSSPVQVQTKEYSIQQQAHDNISKRQKTPTPL